MKPYEIIYEQLGGKVFRTMTGAYFFIYKDKELQFRFRGSRR